MGCCLLFLGCLLLVCHPWLTSRWHPARWPANPWLAACVDACRLLAYFRKGVLPLAWLLITARNSLLYLLADSSLDGLPKEWKGEARI
jgi:hypothetical protein